MLSSAVLNLGYAYQQGQTRIYQMARQNIITNLCTFECQVIPHMWKISRFLKSQLKKDIRLKSDMPDRMGKVALGRVREGDISLVR